MTLLILFWFSRNAARCFIFRRSDLVNAQLLALFYTRHILKIVETKL